MMEEDVPASISIPAPVNVASSDNEELEDVKSNVIHSKHADG